MVQQWALLRPFGSFFPKISHKGIWSIFARAAWVGSILLILAVPFSWDITYVTSVLLLSLDGFNFPDFYLTDSEKCGIL